MEQCGHGGKYVHRLARALGVVVLARGPHESAGAAIGTAGALGDGGLSGLFQHGQDFVRREGRDLGSLCHPPMIVALEAEHVCRAGLVLLAGGLEGHFFREEGFQSGIEEALDTILPFGVAVRVVVHVGSTEQEDCVVIRELGTVYVGAVRLDVSAVKDVILVVHETDIADPIPSTLGPVSICAVVKVARKAGAKVEETAIGDAVLVVIAVVSERDLPAEAATAAVVVACGVGLGIENGLGQCQPLRLIFWWIGEVLLGGLHRGHAPEALVIVAKGCRVVRGLVVLVRPHLVQHRLANDVVVRLVAGVVPVVYHSAPESTTFPPVVIACGRGSREDAGGLAGLIAVVVGHHVIRKRLGGLLDGI